MRYLPMVLITIRLFWMRESSAIARRETPSSPISWKRKREDRGGERTSVTRTRFRVFIDGGLRMAQRVHERSHSILPNARGRPRCHETSSLARSFMAAPIGNNLLPQWCNRHFLSQALRQTIRFVMPTCRLRGVTTRRRGDVNSRGDLRIDTLSTLTLSSFVSNCHGGVNGVKRN